MLRTDDLPFKESRQAANKSEQRKRERGVDESNSFRAEREGRTKSSHRMILRQPIDLEVSTQTAVREVHVLPKQKGETNE